MSTRAARRHHPRRTPGLRLIPNPRPTADFESSNPAERKESIMATRQGLKRIEVKGPRGIVALVRYGTGRFASYRVSYQYRASHWCEYCHGVDGPHARRAFAELVRFYRMPTYPGCTPRTYG
jgi:hypothetical protein